MSSKNFWKIFEISYTQKQILLFLLDLYELLPLLLSRQHFSYFIETVALVQHNENDIPEKWDPEPFGRTLR